MHSRIPICSSLWFFAAAASAAAPMATLELSGEGWQDEGPAALDDLSGEPAVLLFWRHDCLPCLKELESLPALAEENRNIRLMLVSLSGGQETRSHLPHRLPPNVHVMRMTGDANAILTLSGDDRHILPYSLARHANGGLCGKHYGPLGEQPLTHWSRTC